MPPWVLEHLLGRDALLGVETEGTAEQVDALLADGAKGGQKGLPRLRGYDRVRADVLGQLGHAGPDILSRGADALADELDLVELGVARQVGDPQDHLGHNRAHRPDVHHTAVVLGAVEQLGRAVPARDDVRGHDPVRVGEAARQTKIGQLHLTVGCDQQVVGLDIAVQHVVLVAEPDGTTQHTHPRLDIGRTVPDALVVTDEHFEIAEGEVLEDKTDVLVLGREDGQEGDDVGV